MSLLLPACPPTPHSAVLKPSLGRGMRSGADPEFSLPAHHSRSMRPFLSAWSVTAHSKLRKQLPVNQPHQRHQAQDSSDSLEELSSMS